MGSALSKRTAVVAVLAALAGTLALPASGATPQMVPSLTAPFQSAAIGNTFRGTVFASSTEYTEPVRLDLVSDNGDTVWTRTLPPAAPSDGTSQPRNFSVCGDSITSTHYTQDPATGRSSATVDWWSVTSTAHGTADVGEVQVVSAAAGGWITSSTTTTDSATSTTLRFHGRNGLTRFLATVPGRLTGSTACGGASLIVATHDWAKDTRLVQVPLDGTAPVTVDQRPATADAWEDLTPLGVSGNLLAWTRMATDSNFTQSPREVFRSSPQGPVRVAVAPDAQTPIEGGAIGPLGVLVCWPKADRSQGCDAVLYPETGAPVHVETPQTGSFWARENGFVAACSGTYGGCVGLHTIIFPGPTVRQVWTPRQPISIQRWSGKNRYGTSADIIMNNYGPLTSSNGILASGESFPDVLGAGAAAGRFQIPLFLTSRDRLPTEMIQPLTVMKRYRLYVVGGPGAVSEAVVTEAKKYAVQVVRISGTDRYSTAAALSAAFNPQGNATAYVVSGENYPDGLVAAPPAAKDYAPVLLTARAKLPRSTRDELVRLKPSHIVIVGGTGAVSTAVQAQLAALVGPSGSVERLSGSDRYATAVTVSRSRWPDGASAALASGANFPDALSLGPSTQGYEPLLLTGPTRLPDPTRRELQRLRPSGVTIAGGTSVVGTSVEREIRDLPDLP
ncbi:cell wall-binding repeat-containing protein [Pedococcus soli]